MHVTPVEPTQPLVEQASNYFKTVVTKGNPEDFVIQRPKSSTDVEELIRASGAAVQAAALYITKPPLAIEDDLSLPANKVHAELRKTWTKYIEEHTPRGEMAVAATAAAWTAYRDEFATILNDTSKDNIIDPDTGREFIVEATGESIILALKTLVGELCFWTSNPMAASILNGAVDITHLPVPTTVGDDNPKANFLFTGDSGASLSPKHKSQTPWAQEWMAQVRPVHTGVYGKGQSGHGAQGIATYLKECSRKYNAHHWPCSEALLHYHGNDRVHSGPGGSWRWHQLAPPAWTQEFTAMLRQLQAPTLRCCVCGAIPAKCVASYRSEDYGAAELANTEIRAACRREGVLLLSPAALWVTVPRDTAEHLAINDPAAKSFSFKLWTMAHRLLFMVHPPDSWQQQNGVELHSTGFPDVPTLATYLMHSRTSLAPVEAGGPGAVTDRTWRELALRAAPELDRTLTQDTLGIFNAWLQENGTDMFWTQACPKIFAINEHCVLSTPVPGKVRYVWDGVPYWVDARVVDDDMQFSLARSAMIAVQPALEGPKPVPTYSAEAVSTANELAPDATDELRDSLAMTLHDSKGWVIPAIEDAPSGQSPGSPFAQVIREEEAHAESVEMTARMLEAGAPWRNLAFGHPDPVAPSLAGTSHGSITIDPEVQLTVNQIHEEHSAAASPALFKPKAGLPDLPWL